MPSPFCGDGGPRASPPARLYRTKRPACGHECKLAAQQELHTGELASEAAASFTISELVFVVTPTLPTFSDYLAARRIDPRREHAVFDQWDRASRDSTHPECETARTLILRWLTWSDPIFRNRAEMRNIAFHLPFIEGYSSLANDEPNSGPTLEAARSDAQAKEEA